MVPRLRLAVLLPLALLPSLGAVTPSPPPSDSEPPACSGNSGAVLTTYQGVPFYSNGSCTGTWRGSFQCPDAVKRYSLHGDWHGNASTYCEPDALRERNLILLPNEASSPGLDGDIVAFGGPSCGKGVGHVGVRCGTPDASHWSLCDQNRTSRVADNPLRLARTGGALDSFSTNCLVCGAGRPGWDFSDAVGLGTGSHGWTLVDMSLVSADVRAIRLSSRGTTPQLLSPSGLRINPDPRAGGYARLHLFLRSTGGIQAVRVHFTTTSDGAWDEAKAQLAWITDDPGWHDVVVALGENPRWVNGGRIDQIRIDPLRRRYLVEPGGAIELDWMRFDR